MMILIAKQGLTPSVFKPGNEIFWPDKNNLEWHRKKKFGKWI
jgi:hypothetical protein